MDLDTINIDNGILGWTDLHNTCFMMDVDAVRALIDQCANVNARCICLCK